MQSPDAQFWEELRAAIAVEDMDRASTLVMEQMQVWNAQLERMMDQLTHNGNGTVH